MWKGRVIKTLVRVMADEECGSWWWGVRESSPGQLTAWVQARREGGKSITSDHTFSEKCLGAAADWKDYARAGILVMVGEVRNALSRAVA